MNYSSFDFSLILWLIEIYQSLPFNPKVFRFIRFEIEVKSQRKAIQFFKLLIIHDNRDSNEIKPRFLSVFLVCGLFFRPLILEKCWRLAFLLNIVSFNIIRAILIELHGDT